MNVIHGPANLLAALIGFVEAYGQNGLCVFGGHAHEGGHPHPEYRARPAEEDRGCNTSNIPGANGCGQGCHEGVEGADSLIVARDTALPKQVKAEWNLNDGQKSKAKCEVKPDPQNENQHWHAPDDAVEVTNDLCECFHSPLLRVKNYFETIQFKCLGNFQNVMAL